MTRTAAILLLAASCIAQITITAPRLGPVRDSHGRWHYVFGAAGSFVLGPEIPAPRAPDPPVNELTIDGRTLRLEDKLLTVRDPDGREERIPLTQPSAGLLPAGSGWILAAPFAIHLTARGATVFRLPETSR